jgi:hypothetical protein
MEQAVPDRAWKRRARWLTAATVVTAGLVAFGVYKGTGGGSAAAGSTADGAQPVAIEPFGRSGVNRVVLTEQAAQRLGIQTAPARKELVGRRLRTVIPYSALIYGPNGEAWTYTKLASLTFVRRRVRIGDIDGDKAVTSSGLRPGAQVVTVGGEELFGSEIEFAED